MAIIDNTSGDSTCPEGWKNVTIVDEREWAQYEKKDGGGRIKDDELDKYSADEKVLRDKIQFIYETDEVDDDGNPYRLTGRSMNIRAKGPRAGMTNFLKEVAPHLIGKNFDSRKEIVGLRFRVRVDHTAKNDGSGVFVNVGVHTPIETEQPGQTASDIPSHRG